MFCKYCGKEIENGKEVCDECASRQTNVVNEQPEQKIQNISTNKYIQRQKKI